MAMYINRGTLAFRFRRCSLLRAVPLRRNESASSEFGFRKRNIGRTDRFIDGISRKNPEPKVLFSLAVAKTSSFGMTVQVRQ